MLEELRENAVGMRGMRESGPLQISQAFTFIILELTEILSNPNVTSERLRRGSVREAGENNAERTGEYNSSFLRSECIPQCDDACVHVCEHEFNIFCRITLA